MRHLLASLLAAATLAVPAVAAADTLTFVTVDRILSGPTGSGTLSLYVTGRLDGEEEARTIRLISSSSSDTVNELCNRQAVIAMNKPGRWHFVAVANLEGTNMYRVSQCGLTRVD